MQEIAEFTDRIWQAVDKIKDVQEEESGNFKVLVAWKGLATAGDTWEPLSNMYEDVPAKVREFFKKRHKNSLINHAKASLGL